MSTSSSECECDEYQWQYEGGNNTSFRKAYGRNPFYPTMGHPLVYYTEAPQPVRVKHRRRERQKDTPNCFVKAFRWYTQELTPKRNISPNQTDTTGFAVWLDSKYDEFLQQKRMDSDVSLDFKMKMTSEIEIDRISKNDSCTVKKPRRKSPRKRKRRARSSESGGAGHTKSNESLQYLMQPKHMSRPPSECCRSLNNSLGESECTNKPLAKSQSFSNTMIVVKDKKPAYVTPIQEKTKAKESDCNNCLCKPLDGKKSINEKVEGSTKSTARKQDFGCQNCEEKTVKIDAASQCGLDSANTCGYVPSPAEIVDKCACPLFATMTQKPSYRALNTTRYPQKTTVSKLHKNVECQCPEEKVVFVDAQTQYEEMYPKRTFYSTVCECDKGSIQIYTPPLQNTPKISNVSNACPCERKIKEKLTTKRQTVQFSQNTAQTSNHSIRLENETVHEYPLFLKIVCADKL